MGTANTVLAIGGVGALGVGAYYIIKKEGMFDGDGEDDDQDVKKGTLTVNVLDASDSPMRDTDVTLWVGADWHEGTTNSSGIVYFEFESLTDYENVEKLEVDVAPDTQGEWTEKLDEEKIISELLSSGEYTVTVQTSQSLLEIEVVSESSGSPIQDVGVYISGTSDDGDEINESRDTDSSGLATYTAIPKGSYDVEIITDSETYEHSVTTPEDEVVTFEIRVKADIKIECVVDSGLENIASEIGDNVDIKIDGPMSSTEPAGDDLIAEFVGVPQGSYDVSVIGDFVDDVSKEMKLEEGKYEISTTIPRYELSIEATAKETGDYLKGVDVKVSNDSDLGPDYEFTGSTDSDGLVTFQDIPANTLTRVKASLEGEEIYSEQLNKPSADATKEISIEIEGYYKSGSVKARIYGPDGEITTSGKARIVGDQTWQDANSDGDIIITDVPVGTHEVECKPQSGHVAEEKVKEVKVSNDEESTVEFSTDFAEGGSGEIIVSAPLRADGSTVTLYYDGQEYDRKDLTNGTAEWQDMRSTEGTSKTYAAIMEFNGDNYSTEEFMLEEDERVTVEIKLPDNTGSLDVVVVTDDLSEHTKRIADVDVRVKKDDYDEMKYTEENGSAEFRDVPVGDDVYVIVASEADSIKKESGKVTINEDETTDTEVDVSYIEDTVVLDVEVISGDDSGLSDATVTLSSYDDRFNSVTNTNGIAQFDVPPAQYDITANHNYYYSNSTTVTVYSEKTVEMILKRKDTDPIEPVEPK